MKTTPGTICTPSSRIGGTTTTTATNTSSSALYGFSSRPEDRAGKTRLENGEEEMQACFARLMQLVPTIPPDTTNTGRRMSKVQLLQHVIDYILDLEHTLDFRPSDLLHRQGGAGFGGKADESDWVVGLNVSASVGNGFAPSSLLPSTTPQTPRQTKVDRRPLTENVQVNSISPNSVQQTSPTTQRRD